MSYKITLNFQGGRQNHIGNPLNRLDDRECATREDGVTATVEPVVFTFREVIENNAGDAVEFTENDGYLNNNLTVRATCWTDDESLLDSLATFDVTADWEITASSPVSGNTIYFLRRQIEDKIGGEWRYDSENRQFVQVEEEES